MIRMFSRYIYYNIYQGSVNVNKHIHVYIDRDMLPSQHFNARRGIWIRPAVLSAQSETLLSYIVYSAYIRNHRQWASAFLLFLETSSYYRTI